MPQQISFPLGLAVLPETKDPEVFPEFLRIYNAIKLVATMLDSYTGNTPIQSGELRSLESTLKLSTFTRFDAECDGEIAGGRVAYITSEGKAKQPALYGIYPPMKMIPLADYSSGDIGTFILSGLVTFDSAALTPGDNYRHVMGGYIDKDSNIPEYWTHQYIGFALDETHLWFAPDLTYNVYVNPTESGG
jgi:hypothetical protein